MSDTYINLLDINILGNEPIKALSSFTLFGTDGFVMQMLPVGDEEVVENCLLFDVKIFESLFKKVDKKEDFKDAMRIDRLEKMLFKILEDTHYTRYDDDIKKLLDEEGV